MAVKPAVRYYLSRVYGPKEVIERLAWADGCEPASVPAVGSTPIKKAKKKVIEKSTLVIEVKPNSVDTPLSDIEKAVREIKMEGLEWSKAAKQVPIAFGLMKLQMGCIIVDELISTDDVIEKIEQIGMTEAEKKQYLHRRNTGEDDDDEVGGWVQSAEIVSFQKL